MKHQLTFFPSGIKTEAEDQTFLFDAAKACSVAVHNTCGGRGTCGLCKCTVKEKDRESEVLACSYRVTGDAEIYLDTDFDTISAVKKDESADSCTDPFFKLLSVTMPPASSEDRRSTLSRIKSKFPEFIPVDMDFVRSVSAYCPQEIKYLLAAGNLLCEAFSCESSVTVGVVDLGTTSVKASLIDLRAGKIVAEASCRNKQCMYGADIISRIIAAESHLQEMSKAAEDTVFRLFEYISERFKLVFPSAFIISANTAMLHIFHGINPSSIRKIPNIPTAGEYPPVRRRGYAIFSVPSITGYAGGDVVSGIISCRMHERELPSMLIDLGTNGEIAVGCRDWTAVCSASAGPAFEGGGLKCGTWASSGAISSVSIADGKFAVKTIGDAPPSGICSGGILSFAAEMFRHGFLDKRGRFSSDAPGFEYFHGTRRVVICRNSKGNPIFADEDDILNFIRAKAAIYAGCETLLLTLGLGFEDMDKIYLAGSIAEFAEIRDCIEIGLFPDLPCDMFVSCGNASLRGAEDIVFSDILAGFASQISSSAFYVDLSFEKVFMDRWTASLFIPHTD